MMSYETHSAKWLGFRQPVLRVAREKHGRALRVHLRGEPGRGLGRGRVLDRALLAHRPGRQPRHPQALRIALPAGREDHIDEYYRGSSRTRVPGLPEQAAEEGLTPLDYMRKYGAFAVEDKVYNLHETPAAAVELDGADDGCSAHGRRQARRARRSGIVLDGKPVSGFPTPSRKLEFYSRTLRDWKWPEYALPSLHQEPRPPGQPGPRQRASSRSSRRSACRRSSTRARATRSGSTRSRTPIPCGCTRRTPQRLGVKTGDLLKVNTEIGYFVSKVWVTEGDPAGRGRLLAPSRPLAPEQDPRVRSLVVGAGRPEGRGDRPLADAAARGDQALQERRPGLRARLVDRRAASTRI